MKPYQPSQKTGRNGPTWLILSSLIGGITIGGITWVISLVLYLVLFFPLLMGGMAGQVMVVAIRKGKVRNPKIVALFGMFMSLVLYGTVHTGDYLFFKQNIAEQIEQEYGPINQAEFNQMFDSYLKQSTGSTGFLGFLKLSAQEGVSIGDVGSSSDGNNLGEIGTWIYWTIELSIIMGIVVVRGVNGARLPFCEASDQWYGTQEQVGWVIAPSSDSFLKHLKSNELDTAAHLMITLPEFNLQEGLIVGVQRCPNAPNADVVLTVTQISTQAGGNLQVRTILQGMIGSEQFNQFEQAVSRSQQREETAQPSQETIALAQHERTTVQSTDLFLPHGLNPDQVQDIYGQLCRYRQVQTAYLVQKKVYYRPQEPLYILGIERRRSWVESELADQNLAKKLALNLDFPGQFRVVPLNKNPAIKKALKVKQGIPFYSRSKS
jgi:hypothetical protein